MRRSGLASGTVKKRRGELRSWERWIGAGWSSATWRDVEAWVSARPLGARAQASAVSHLRAFYRWARREGLTDADPCRDVEVPRIPRRLPRPASERDVRRAVGTGAATLELAAALMAYAGLRCCEVAVIDWADVDLVAGRIHVIGKGNREGYVPIVAPLAAVLAAGDGHTGRIITSTAGRAVTAARVSQLMGAHLRRRGADCTAHRLRHYAGTRMLELGHDIMVVRDFLRHASVAQTEGYAQLAGGRLAEIAATW